MTPALWTEAQWQSACPLRPAGFVDQPVPGYFRIRLVAKGPWCAARIYTYRPRVAGQDHLAAHINGEPAEVWRVYTYGRAIDEKHYRALMEQPASNPRQPVSRRKLKETEDD